MKKLALLTLIVIIAALSVMSVSAAPRDRYYDQSGDRHWCNTDSYGCWVTNEDGGKDYIMFWSEAAAEWIMGPNSGAPIGIYPNAPQLELDAPREIQVNKDSGGGITQPECGENKNCPKGQKCDKGICVQNTTGQCTKNSECPEEQLCQNGECISRCTLTTADCYKSFSESQYNCSVSDNCACSCTAKEPEPVTCTAEEIAACKKKSNSKRKCSTTIINNKCECTCKMVR